MVALSYINSRVGNAPLNVKYGLRAYLRGLHAPAYQQSRNPKFVRAFYIEHTNKFLDSFKIDNKFPWKYLDTSSNIDHLALRGECFSLLTMEEKALLSRFHKNI